MKKMLALSAFLLLLVSACDKANPSASPTAAQTPSGQSLLPSQSTAASASPEQTPASTPVPSADAYQASGYIDGQEDNGLYTHGMSRLDVKAIHLTQDRLAVLELYVDAQLDDKGAVMWDDGQEWALVVHEGDYIYPLFEKKYVQLGEVSFTDSWQPETGRAQITVRVRQHEFLDSYECIFEADSNRFARVDLPQQTVAE